MKPNKQWVLGMLGLSMLVYTCKVSQNALKRDANGKVIVDTNPSPAYLTPQESLKTIHLPKGYHLELVASEPMIHELRSHCLGWQWTYVCCRNEHLYAGCGWNW
ncbi:hypothetical protein [Pedobacter steynii]